MADQKRTGRPQNPGESHESRRQGSDQPDPTEQGSNRQGSGRQGSERQGSERQGSSRQSGTGTDRSSSTSGTDRDFDESGESINQGHGHPREERGRST